MPDMCHANRRFNSLASLPARALPPLRSLLGLAEPLPDSSKGRRMSLSSELQPSYLLYFIIFIDIIFIQFIHPHHTLRPTCPIAPSLHLGTSAAAVAWLSDTEAMLPPCLSRSSPRGSASLWPAEPPPLVAARIPRTAGEEALEREKMMTKAKRRHENLCIFSVSGAVSQNPSLCKPVERPIGEPGVKRRWPCTSDDHSNAIISEEVLLDLDGDSFKVVCLALMG